MSSSSFVSWRMQPSGPCKGCRLTGARSSLAATPPPAFTDDYSWTGEDEFSHLNDRSPEPAQPLPDLTERKRIVLVRHGQSTWNAEGRIQGSTDFAILTSKGQNQAQTTYEMLKDENFDKLFHSPLRRASETASIVWGDSEGPISVLPGLREIDLYSFQGLLKAEGKATFGDEFRKWQIQPAEFEIDGHLPVRELWRRASKMWHDILLDPDIGTCALVVAHNAVNQALIGSALGLPPTYFRRLVQSNAASTVLDFVPSRDGRGADVSIDRLNQSPGRPFAVDGTGVPTSQRIILVRHAATVASDERAISSNEEPCSSLGEVQAYKAGELLMDVRVDSLIVGPTRSCVDTATAIAKLQSLNWDRAPRVQEDANLLESDMGVFEGCCNVEIPHRAFPEDAACLSDFWTRTKAAWDGLRAQLARDGSGTLCVVASAGTQAALLCHCLDLDQTQIGRFRMAAAGVTIIELLPSPPVGVVRCHNYTAHLGRWAVPITPDSEPLVCGVEGCF